MTRSYSRNKRQTEKETDDKQRAWGAGIHISTIGSLTEKSYGVTGYRSGCLNCFLLGQAHSPSVR